MSSLVLQGFSATTVDCCRTPHGDIVAGDLGHLLASWELHLQALNRSPKMITTYLEAARQLVAFLADQGMPTQAVSIHREHIEAFVVHLQQTRSASTAANC